MFTILVIIIGLSAILELIVGPQAALLAELFPAKTRNSAATLPHNVAAGWIGGFASTNCNLAQSVLGKYYSRTLVSDVFLASGTIIAMIYLP